MGLSQMSFIRWYISEGRASKRGDSTEGGWRAGRTEWTAVRELVGVEGWP